MNYAGDNSLLTFSVFSFVVDCFGRKRVTLFKVQLYICAFLRRKAVEKPFAAQTPQRKRGYVEDFAYRNNVRLRNLKNPRFALSLKLCCEIAARQARGWGWYLNVVLVDTVQLLCHVTLRSA